MEVGDGEWGAIANQQKVHYKNFLEVDIGDGCIAL